jgi:7,8-dihydropterin-6-yl-methyl-4-(beta-D-ribofuranosyl)aminobenzene 5'-phosphate synthase
MLRKLTFAFVLLLTSFLVAAASPQIDPAAVSLLDVYDNVSLETGLKADWGFSCLIRAGGNTILFDTGRRGPILLGNLTALGVDPAEIGIVVLSHFHPDHVGGLELFLQKNERVTLYVPQSFLAQRSFKKLTAKHHATVSPVSGPRMICDRVWTTGELGRDPIEQALCLETPLGSVVITGCAHPGIVEIARQARTVLKADPRYVLGGFHLADLKDARIEEIIGSLREMGVRYVAPTHCTGERPLAVFRREYGEDCLELGVGGKLIFGPAGIEAGR